MKDFDSCYGEQRAEMVFKQNKLFSLPSLFTLAQ